MSVVVKPRLVVLASRLPWSLDKGDKLRLYHQIKELSADYHIYLICLSHRPPEWQHIEPLLALCTSVRYFTLSRSKRLFNVVRAYFTKMPLQVAYFYDARLHHQIITYIGLIDPAIVYTQLLRMAPYGADVEGYKVLDYMDAGGLNKLAEQYSTNLLSRLILRQETKKVQDYEAFMFSFFDHATVISERDRLSMPERIRKDLVVVNNGVNVPKSLADKREGKKVIGFIGNLSYRHNQRAVDYLLDELIPLLPEDITIHIAGAGHYDRLSTINFVRVNYLGYVDSVQAFFADITLFIAAIFSGSGIQNKVLEAMAHAVPVVTTSFVNEAIRGSANYHLLVSDTSEGMAKSIIDLLSQPENMNKLGLRGKEFVQEHFCWEEVTRPLKQIFKKCTDESEEVG